MRNGLNCLFAAATVAAAFSSTTVALGAQPGGGAGNGPPQGRPNILFIILDDVGIDQFAIFNPHPDAVDAPVIRAVAESGVKFTNVHAMPECSPSRASFFTGRYPLRTGVDAALLPEDQPRAQLSPYEMTTPKLLRRAQYQSVMIGKYHLGGPENNPYGAGAPREMGWDYFDGTLEAAPAGNDSTLGGQYTEDRQTYCWGFPIGEQTGVGWFLGPNGSIFCDDNNGHGYTGVEIASRGGIPALDQAGNFATTCEAAMNSGRTVRFDDPSTQYNGYYRWSHVVNTPHEITESVSRQYIVTAQTDAAIDWIQNKSGPQPHPWMVTVSYSAIHTPYQLPPPDLYPPDFIWPSNVPQNDCSDPQTITVVSDLMLYAMDKEIGRLLVNIGLGSYGHDGRFTYNPDGSNTMVVIVGDNGTYWPSVKQPYNPLRAKGTAYQPAILTPLVIGGPMVEQRGRTVQHLVSSNDLFELFGEVAGVDVRRIVPRTHVLDSRPMLGYLTTPNRAPYRETVYAELGMGLKSGSDATWPVVFPIRLGPVTVYNCIDILITSQALAETNGGIWYGPGAPRVYSNCCDLRANEPQYPSLGIAPDRRWTVRSEHFKLVRQLRPECDANLGEYEFYDLRLGPDNGPLNLLDNGQVPSHWTCPSTVPLFCEWLTNYNLLLAELNAILASEVFVEGDGNLDKRVTGEDVAGVLRYWGEPSWFDFNNDGTTDQEDLDIVLRNLRAR
jgi:arylsulfatase A-like enzyme